VEEDDHETNSGSRYISRQNDSNDDRQKDTVMPPSSSVKQSIEFTGNAREYFGIWIANLILSIITLGIYSAWAKVRRETYFKNNTKIRDAGFGYHATGGQIFKGRVIAFFVLVVFNILSAVDPIFALVLLAGAVFVVPWVLNSSLRFAARMTSYRNVRFNWQGTYWQTFWFFVIAPFVGLISLGLLYPWITRSYYAYFANHHTYGTTRFASEPKVRDFYLAFLLGGILPAVLITMLIFCITMISVATTSSLQNGVFPAVILLLTVFFYALIFSIAFIYRVLCRNLMLRSAALGGVVGFDSQISPTRFVWIALSNLLVTILTVGLMLPWAKVRMYRYLSQSTLISIEGDVDRFIDDARVSQGTFGEGLADLEGVEVSI
jgi:uncharacterized membrane protein YjgN (DUF898 family)